MALPKRKKSATKKKYKPKSVAQRKSDATFRPNVRLKANLPKGPSPASADCELVRIILEDYRRSDNGEPLYLEKTAPHVVRILNHMFTPHNGRLKYRTMVYSCPKKSLKTEIAAAVSYAWARTYGGDMYSIANDKMQAKERAFDRLTAALNHIKRAEPSRFADEIHPDYHRAVTKNDLVVFGNGGQLKAVPLDPYGEAGGMQTLTVWDELWGFKTTDAARMWTEMQPLPPGVGGVEESVRFIVTYAGWYGESDLLWNLYEQVCQPDEQHVEQGQKVNHMEDLPLYALDDICVYWDHQARMPWHTPEFLAKARREETRQAEYDRIWENRWTTGLEPFIDMPTYDSQAKAGDDLGLFNHLDAVRLADYIEAA